MELALIGLQNAGKTSLVNVVATGGFDTDMIPTVGFNMRKVTKGSVTIKVWDLGGQPRFRSMYGIVHARHVRTTFAERSVGFMPAPTLDTRATGPSRAHTDAAGLGSRSTRMQSHT